MFIDGLSDLKEICLCLFHLLISYASTDDEERLKKANLTRISQECAAHEHGVLENRGTLQITTPSTFAKWLLQSGLQRVDSKGKHCGNWVFDTTILHLLEFLCPDDLAVDTCLSEKYEVRVCYIDATTMTVELPDLESKTDLDRNMLLLVTHIASETVGLHYNVIIINSRLKILHVFDTMKKWKDCAAKRVVVTQFPCMKWQGYKVRNHTQKLHQVSATCGPWSLWICFAYAFNYKNCRLADDKIVYACLQDDAISFWKEVTF